MAESFGRRFEGLPKHSLVAHQRLVIANRVQIPSNNGKLKQNKTGNIQIDEAKVAWPTGYTTEHYTNTIGSPLRPMILTKERWLWSSGIPTWAQALGQPMGFALYGTTLSIIAPRKQIQVISIVANRQPMDGNVLIGVVCTVTRPWFDRRRCCCWNFPRPRS